LWLLLAGCLLGWSWPLVAYQPCWSRLLLLWLLLWLLLRLLLKLLPVA
jgi:hypothetical protein